MQSKTYTVAFEGLEAQPVRVECALSPGLPSFSIVGLPAKAVSEARERIRAALSHLAIALPAKRITVNLSPADMPKDGAHFDLPIAVALLTALEFIPLEEAERIVSMGELSLTGGLVSVRGALPAAVAAGGLEAALFCPHPNASEAAWVGATAVYGPQSLAELLAHFAGRALLPLARPGEVSDMAETKDFRDVRGQERAKRALEIAAAGRHHLFLVGPPGAGKSMMAARLASILPPLTAEEALETSMIQSVAGVLEGGGISKTRPYRAPHHTASMPALVGGGRGAGPGEISLAHNGVLFLDEFPEFPRPVLETLRQPLETGHVLVARANAHVRYPCKFLLVAAANPCRCGHLYSPEQACGRAPLCGEDYIGRISGPLMDRFDLRLEVPAVTAEDLRQPAAKDGSAEIAQRVAAARERQSHRYADCPDIRVNADCEGETLIQAVQLSPEGERLMEHAVKTFHLSARGYHRILRVARTIADLAGSEDVADMHLAEALSFRLVKPVVFTGETMTKAQSFA